MEPTPPSVEEILCDPTSPEIVLMQLRKHLRSCNLSLSGIACYDCESMDLTARIAGAMGLDYPSAQSIRNSRDKSRTKNLWRQHNVPCARSSIVSSEEQVCDFFEAEGGVCVLKPVDGSGSELVFRCCTKEECLTAFKTIEDNRTTSPILMEGFVEGAEYSCDFIVDRGKVDIIRITRKLHKTGHVFGTIMAYEVIEFLSENISRDYLAGLLGKAAAALGITRAMCMMDFMVQGSDITLLELSPRPGGDCLPWLIKRSMDLDTLKMALDFAENKEFEFKKPLTFIPHVGLRIHALRAGRLKQIDASRVLEDHRVTDVHIKHRPGHVINLPPHDYDSWNLGHIIFKPAGLVSRSDQCRELLSFLRIDIEHESSRSKQHKPVAACAGHPRPADSTTA